MIEGDIMEEKINTITNQNENLDNQEEKLLKYKISHLISANRLKVYVRIDLIDKETEINYEDILNYVKEQGIIYGINENEIRNYCDKKEFAKELVAASGKDPFNGKNAEVVYNFDTSKGNKLIERKDGTIDFQNLNNIINVKKDDVLCHIIPAQEGADGIDIYGNKIEFKKGENANFNNGKNTYITDDGLQLKSSADGCVKISGSAVLVEDIYTVNNVDNETGNIDFNGSVIINGDVRAGFSVKAKQDIKVRGLVEGAYIEAGGDLVINKGMNGMGKGTIYAKGNITSKYIENAIIKSEKSIYAEALINSDVTAKESIILRGQNAAIIGGISRANDMIYAKTIGSKINSETNLVIDLSNYQEEQAAFAKKRNENLKFKNEFNNKNKELKELEETIDFIFNSNIENKNVMHKSLILKRMKLNNEINDIKKLLEEDIPTDNIANHKVICKGIIYTNTRIAIGWMKYRVKQDVSYSKIYNDGSDITVVALNPSDLD